MLVDYSNSLVIYKLFLVYFLGIGGQTKPTCVGKIQLHVDNSNARIIIIYKLFLMSS